jgi:hypothetical protein
MLELVTASFIARSTLVAVDGEAGRRRVRCYLVAEQEASVERLTGIVAVRGLAQ